MRKTIRYSLITAILLTAIILVARAAAVDANTSGGDIAAGLFAWVILTVLAIIFAAVYFLPTLISLKKTNSIAIFALNLLLGWTFLGWVAALVWALTKDRK